MAIISSIEYCNENNVPIMTIGNGVGEKTGVTYEGSVSWVGENETKTGGLAGEIAHARLSAQDGNSTYRNYIIDAIYNMTPEQLEEGAKYEVR